jgi:hypothetical protein
VNPKAAFSDDFVKFVDADLSAIVSFLSAPGHEPTLVYPEDEGVKNLLVTIVEGDVEEDLPVVSPHKRLTLSGSKSYSTTPKWPRTLDHSRPPFFQLFALRTGLLAYFFFAALTAVRAFWVVNTDFFDARLTETRFMLKVPLRLKYTSLWRVGAKPRLSSINHASRISSR